jgi:hypothetical protein
MHPSLTLDAAGNAHVAWAAEIDSGALELHYAMIGADGAPPTAPVLLGSNDGGLDLVFQDRRSGLAQIYLQRREAVSAAADADAPSPAAWSDAKLIPARDDGGSVGLPSAVVSESGGLRLSVAREPKASALRGLLYLALDDSGQPLADPAAITEDGEEYGNTVSTAPAARPSCPRTIASKELPGRTISAPAPTTRTRVEDR